MIATTPAAQQLPSTDRWLWLGLIPIFFAALFLRLHGLDRSLWLDEAGSIQQARAADFLTAARADIHPPLYHAILRLGFTFTESVPWLRSFSVACGLGLVAFGALLGRPSRLGMLIGAAMFALLPGFIYHAQELRPYALLHLLFAAALFLTIRHAETRPVASRSLLLTAVLLLAAGTHQLTAFFLVALTPLIIWPARHSGARAIGRQLLPLVPAAVVVLGFNFAFLQRPDRLANGWWVPSVSGRYVWDIARDTAGWFDLERFFSAIGRHTTGGRLEILALTITALGLVGVVLALRPRLDAISRLLVLAATLYFGALLAYSLTRESILLTRTALPGILILVAALARGLGDRPPSRTRSAAAAALLLYLSTTAASFALYAHLPREDLRGLAGTIRAHARSGDLLVLFRGLDFALQPYWPELTSRHPLVIEQTAPTAVTLSALRARLDQDFPPRRLHLLYRADFYFDAKREIFTAIIAELNLRQFKTTELWRKDSYVVLTAEASAPASAASPHP